MVSAAADKVSLQEAPAGSGFCQGEARWRKCRDVQAWVFSGDQIGHDFRGDWGQQDAVAEMTACDKDARFAGRPENGQVVWRSRAQTGPALDDGGGCQLRQISGGRPQ